MHLTTSSAPTSSAAWVALLCCAAFVLGMYVWYGFALSRMFPKLGSEGRKAWIPVVNDAEILTLGGVPSWTVLLNFVPVVNLYAIALRVRATSRVNAGFGKGRGMTTLAILLPPLWATILAASQPLSVASRMAPPTSRRAALTSDADDTDARGHLAHPVSDPIGSESGVEASDPESPTSERQTSENPTAGNPTSADALAAAAPGRISPYLDSSSAVRAPSPTPSPGAHEPPTRSLPVHEPPIRPLTPPTAPAPSTSAIPPVSPASPVAPVAPVTPIALVVPVAPVTPIALVADVAPIADGDFGDGDFADGETVLVDRRPKARWRLVVEDLGEFAVTGTHVLIGRKPGTAEDTQTLALPDTTLTLSKVHARLDWVDDEWVITDLNSTNGVVIVAADGTERVLDAGEAAVVGSGIGSSSFVLGSLAMSIALDGPST